MDAANPVFALYRFAGTGSIQPCPEETRIRKEDAAQPGESWWGLIPYQSRKLGFLEHVVQQRTWSG